MGSRRVYRAIEEAALLGNFTDCGCPHTIVSRRLRHTYRESRDVMRLREVRAMALACVYGNPQLDAVKGFKNIVQACKDVGDLIFYFDVGRKASERATMDYANPNTQVMLLRELRKNISKETAIGEIEQVFGKQRNEKHVLGGRKTNDTEAEK